MLNVPPMSGVDWIYSKMMLAKVMVLGCFKGGHFSQTLGFFPLKRKDTLPETNKLPMKMKGWKTIFAPFGNGSPSLQAPPNFIKSIPYQKYGLMIRAYIDSWLAFLNKAGD